MIILPLPFVDKLIVEAYPENPAAARQAIDYLVNSTNQQAVAARAMAGITANILGRCQTMGDIVAVAGQLAWIPSPPPAALGPVLPQFLEISQGVAAAKKATSPYRQSELLAPPANSLANLKKSLALGQDARLTTAFGAITESWLNILASARRTLKEQVGRSTEIPQPYVAGPALAPESAGGRFRGRQDLFREIESLVLVEPPPVLLLQGGRRTGKTSALKYLPRQVGPELIPLLIDMQGVASAVTLAGLAENMAGQMIEAARQARNLQLPPPDAYELARDPFPALQKWLKKLERLARGKRFLLCLDEFERLSEVIEATGSRAPLNFVRHLLQHQPQWLVLFSSAHALAELPTYWSDYLINTRTLRVSYLKETEARELIEQPVADFPDIYQAEAVASIIKLTRCQPFLLQLLCSTLVEQLNREGRRLATAKDVQTAAPTAIETGGFYFRELWHSLTAKEQKLLLKLARQESPVEASRPLIQRLVQKEILEKKENGCHFQVPLVQMFVEQVIMEEV